MKLTVTITLEDQETGTHLSATGYRSIKEFSHTHSLQMLVVALANSVIHKAMGKYVGYLRNGRLPNDKLIFGPQTVKKS